MAQKTVLKLLIAKYGPKSVEIQNALIADQGEIKDVETLDVSYPDEGKVRVTQEELQELYKMKEEFVNPEKKEELKRIIDNNEVAHFNEVKDILVNL